MASNPYSPTTRQPQYRGDIETVFPNGRRAIPMLRTVSPSRDPKRRRAVSLAKKSADLTVALHGVLTKAIEAERGSLNAEDLDNMQAWLNNNCSDLVSECITHALASSGVDMSDVHVAIPDFAALAAAGPVSPNSKEAISELVLAHAASSGNGGEL